MLCASLRIFHCWTCTFAFVCMEKLCNGNSGTYSVKDGGNPMKETCRWWVRTNIRQIGAKKDTYVLDHECVQVLTM